MLGIEVEEVAWKGKERGKVREGVKFIRWGKGMGETMDVGD